MFFKEKVAELSLAINFVLRKYTVRMRSTKEKKFDGQPFCVWRHRFHQCKGDFWL